MPASPKQARATEDAEAETIRLYQEGLSTHEIAHRLGVQPPCIRRRLLKRGLWKTNSRDAINGSASGQMKKKRAADIRAENEEAAVTLTSVDRTPCTFCGVRADIGCRHNKEWGKL